MIDRTQYQRTAGHPPAGVPLRSGYNPDATVTRDVPGFGGDKYMQQAAKDHVNGVYALIRALYAKG